MAFAGPLTTMHSAKRPRSSSPSPSRSLSPPSSPTSKLLKTVSDTPNVPLTCTLPPTCSHPHKPTQLSSTRDLEAHYATYHSHVCEYKGCGKVFPDARLLDLHFAECHDPITALKKERGEKTFACHLFSCPRLFLTPKARRLHLIQAHNYPKEYFFAVTNKGIGGLLSKWGQGASLIRGEWKARVQDQEMESSDSDAEGAHHSLTHGRHGPSHMEGADTFDSPTTDPTIHSDTIPILDGSPHDSLADAMSSLSLVPSKIRFGRGGKKGGFVHPHQPKEKGKGSYTFPSENIRNVNVEDDGARQPRRRGGRRGRRKASEGTSSTGGEPDSMTMQD